MASNLESFGRIVVAAADLENALLQLLRAAGQTPSAGLTGLTLDAMISRCVDVFREPGQSQALRDEMDRLEAPLRRASQQRNQLTRAAWIQPLAALHAATVEIAGERPIALYLRARPCDEVDAVARVIAAAADEAWGLYDRMCPPEPDQPGEPDDGDAIAEAGE